MLGATATSRIPSEPPSRPTTIQGRRIPSRDDVRSLILPKNGLPKSEKTPTPVTSAKLFGARSVPTNELTFNAGVTSKGARNSRMVPMYASVYREIKPQPTRRAAGAQVTMAVSRISVRPFDARTRRWFDRLAS